MYRLSDMEVVAEYPLSELDNFKKHHRLRVFYFFGTMCVACGIEGTKLVKLQHKLYPEHVTHDVFTKNMRLMTVDHIIPKSMGGGNTLENLQPMCQRCNNIKADHDITNEELGIIVREKVRYFEVSARIASLRNRAFTI